MAGDERHSALGEAFGETHDAVQVTDQVISGGDCGVLNVGLELDRSVDLFGCEEHHEESLALSLESSCDNGEGGLGSSLLTEYFVPRSLVVVLGGMPFPRPVRRPERRRHVQFSFA